MPRTKQYAQSDVDKFKQMSEADIKLSISSFGRAWTLDVYTKALDFALERYKRNPDEENMMSMLSFAYLYRYAVKHAQSDKGPA